MNSDLKVAFGVIVFNGNFVLEEALKSVYPFANQIVVAEGPVKFWQNEGYNTSNDGTNDILDNFRDPDNKLKVIHSQYNEKTEQANKYISELWKNNDYIWHLDADEIFKPEDIETVFKLLKDHKFTTAGFRSATFYGGFEKILGGFEEAHEFKRLAKFYPGSKWKTHRPPTINHTAGNRLPEKHLKKNDLYDKHGVRIYHYSYVFPRQVKEKIHYYKKAISKNNCIDNYFENVYLRWVNGEHEQVEKEYNGVHEFKPKTRGECKTKPFDREHPEIIQNNMNKLKNKFNEQLGKKHYV